MKRLDELIYNLSKTEINEKGGKYGFGGVIKDDIIRELKDIKNLLDELHKAVPVEPVEAEYIESSTQLAEEHHHVYYDCNFYS